MCPAEIFSVSPLPAAPAPQPGVQCSPRSYFLQLPYLNSFTSATLSIFCSLKPCLHAYGHTIILPSEIPSLFILELSKTDIFQGPAELFPAGRHFLNAIAYRSISLINLWHLLLEQPLGLNESTKQSCTFFHVPKETVNLSLAHRSCSTNINLFVSFLKPFSSVNVM